MVDRRDRRSSRTTRRPARASAAGRQSGGASAGRKTTSKGRARATRRAKPAPPKTAAKSTRTLKRKTSGRERVAPVRTPKRGQTAKAKPSPSRTPLPSTSAEPLANSAAVPAPVAASMLAPESAPVPVPVRRRRRGPRVKFTHWLYSDELYRQLGVSPRGQALVCRELRAERDGSWSARVAAVPAGFFEATWVIVPPEVVVPVARPKRVDATH